MICVQAKVLACGEKTQGRNHEQFPIALDFSDIQASANTKLQSSTYRIFEEQKELKTSWSLDSLQTTPRPSAMNKEIKRKVRAPPTTKNNNTNWAIRRRRPTPLASNQPFASIVAMQYLTSQLFSHKLAVYC